MSIHGVTYERPTDRHAGAQQGGMSWLPRMPWAEFAGIMAGDVALALERHTYTGIDAWLDGVSEPVGKTSHVIEGARARNLMRAIWPHFVAIKAALEEEVAAEIGGVVVADPDPPWISEPMEPIPGRDPEPEPDPEPEGDA